MSESLANTLYLAAAFLTLFASAEWLYHRWKVRAEFTRKYVHIVTGLLTMLFPPLIGNHWLVMALCGSFLLILLASLYLWLLPSINAVDRVTRGSILYPVIVYACYLVYSLYDQPVFFYVPILVLAICDPVAALVGKHWPMGQYVTFGKTKTFSGSLGFFFAALLTTTVLLIGLGKTSGQDAWITALGVALASTLAEALVHKGYDNLSIPASALTVLIIMNECTSIEWGIPGS